MTRSVAGKNLTARVGTASAGVAAIFALSLVAGCSAGQIAETAKIQASVPGGNAVVNVPDAGNPNSKILLENVTVDYNGPTGYAIGGSAGISLNIINQTSYQLYMAPEPPQQVFAYDADGQLGTTAIGKLTLSDGSTGVTVPAGSASPSVPPSPSTSTSGSPSASPSGSGSPSAPGSPSASPTPVVKLSVDPAQFAALGSDSTQKLQITDLTAPLVPGTVVQLALIFVTVGPDGALTPYTSTVTAPIAPSMTAGPRSEASAPPSNG